MLRKLLAANLGVSILILAVVIAIFVVGWIH